MGELLLLLLCASAFALEDKATPTMVASAESGGSGGNVPG